MVLIFSRPWINGMPKQLMIVVPGIPLAKKRHRTVPLQQCLSCQRKVQGMYKECPDCNGALRFLSNMSYSDSESVRYENLISYCAKQAMQQQKVEMFTGAIRVRMTFLFPVPVSRQCSKIDHHSSSFAQRNGCKKLHAGDSHTQRPDLDNLNKSLDGLNGIVFADDCIIAEASARKLWAAEGKAEIVVEEL